MIKSHSGLAIVTKDSLREPLNDDHKAETPFQNKKPFCCSHCDKRFTQRDPVKEKHDDHSLKHFVMMKSHSAPPIVTRDSHKDTLRKSNIMTTSLKHIVMMKSHSGAPIVTRDPPRETLWKSNMMSTSLKHLVMIKSHSGPAIVTRDSRRDPLNDDHKDKTPFQNKKPCCCSHCDKRFTQWDPLNDNHKD